MPAWYKHDIAAWMDGTEGLDADQYRAYHVICQLIYLNEGPIRSHSEGIAGRCKMSVRRYRKALESLLSQGLISEKTGRLFNSRAEKELENLKSNRENAAKGGKAKAKSLENNKSALAPPNDTPALRLEESRVEETRKESPIGDTRAKKKSKPRSLIDPDKPITVAQKEHAVGRGIHVSRVDTIFEKFRNYHRSKGNLMADWDAAWRTWVGNEVERYAPPPTQQKSLVYGDDYG